jgi:hypothetical protein
MKLKVDRNARHDLRRILENILYFLRYCTAEVNWRYQRPMVLQ